MQEETSPTLKSPTLRIIPKDNTPGSPQYQTEPPTPNPGTIKVIVGKEFLP